VCERAHAPVCARERIRERMQSPAYAGLEARALAPDIPARARSRHRRPGRRVGTEPAAAGRDNCRQCGARVAGGVADRRARAVGGRSGRAGPDGRRGRVRRLQVVRAGIRGAWDPGYGIYIYIYMYIYIYIYIYIYVYIYIYRERD
jgi:hypothetical protein